MGATVQVEQFTVSSSERRSTPQATVPRRCAPCQSTTPRWRTQTYLPFESRIEPRQNRLGLIEAAASSGLPHVTTGRNDASATRLPVGPSRTLGRSSEIARSLHARPTAFRIMISSHAVHRLSAASSKHGPWSLTRPDVHAAVAREVGGSVGGTTPGCNAMEMIRRGWRPTVLSPAIPEATAR